MFTHPFLLVGGFFAMGVLFVFAPVFYDALQKYRRRKVITCPETHSLAEVNIKAGLGALGAAVGQPVIRVKDCSLWPKRQGCDQKCVTENWPTA